MDAMPANIDQSVINSVQLHIMVYRKYSVHDLNTAVKQDLEYINLL